MSAVASSEPMRTPASELLEQFEQAARNAAATVERVQRSAEALDVALRRATQGATRILLAEPQQLPAELFELYKRSAHPITSPTEEELRASQAGITEAFAGVARTGSICVSVAGLTGAVSLLAPLHVAVLPAENIVARPGDLVNRSAPGSAGDFVFITGPSATADMGPLVRGVHGPHRLHIVILV